MRVAVVGAGIAGLSTAWSLNKRGHEVTLFEQAAGIPNPYAASGDQHRIIRRAYGGADGYARTISEAFEAWEELWADLGVRHYAACGVLGISQTEGDEGEDYRQGLDRMGSPYELYDPAEAARRYPFLDPATIRYAYLSPEGGALFPARIAADMVRLLRERGVSIREGVAVTAIEPEAGKLTLADGKAASFDRIVVSAGAWVLKLLPELADALTTYRTAIAYLDPPEDLKAAWEAAPAIVDVGGTVDGYVLPPVDGTELKVGAGVHKRQRQPDEDREPRPGEGEQIRDYFSPPFARIDEYRVKRVASCAYTFTADRKFLSREIGRVTAVSACSGHGYKFGAAVGRRVAAAVENGDQAGLLRWLRAE
ncbi:NAD(P)/FAD-dependent oxidoreductase [Bosea sp. NBC_00550]|uniref:NAD(P)/FAD-dependent oxidoreductase n=1 Tax=Bosea sp. NBC_00550 TaxID=2969621 RepID=UPI00222ED893|nr:FAD-dependent oxidoreductase [Bosea sp. NBC_00550]UZF93898.1 FAD-dependent oxidoreductase [Bosea sp. NBC_00550]